MHCYYIWIIYVKDTIVLVLWGWNVKLPQTCWLKTNFSIMVVEAWSPKKKKKVSSRRYALWGSRGEYFHFFCCFWWNQIFLGLSLCDCNLCLHLQMAFSPVGLYISNVPLFSLIGTIVTEFGVHYKHRIISSQDPQLNYVFKESISK